MWIILSPRERTHLHRASTWADLLIVVVAAVEVEAAAEVEVVAGGEILTMIEDMIVGTTDTKTTITGTEEDHLLLITVGTDHDQDLVLTAQDAIDKLKGCCQGHVFFLFSFFFLILDFLKLLILPTL